MRKPIDKVKRVKLIITILDPLHWEDEDFEERELEITIPEYEWSSLIHAGEFSWHFNEVIEGYRRWLEGVAKCEVHICFEEIKEEQHENHTNN